MKVPVAGATAASGKEKAEVKAKNGDSFVDNAAPIPTEYDTVPVQPLLNDGMARKLCLGAYSSSKMPVLDTVLVPLLERIETTSEFT